MKHTIGKKIATRIPILVAVAVVATTVIPTAAQATKGDCEAGWLCLWYNRNYTHTLYHTHASDPHLGNHSDEAHSVYNNTQRAYVLYDDINYEDRAYCIKARVSNSDIGATPYKFGDKISSVRRLGSNNCEGIPEISQN